MKRASIAVVAGLLAALFAAVAPVQAQLKRPNIVIILGDDLGFADMGVFGSEIKTPNLDALANEGVRFANFYTHASCSPTRSVLLTGVDTHLNGLGNMDEWTAPNQWGVDGYEGYLNNQVVTLPQLLKEAGYHTYINRGSGLELSVSQICTSDNLANCGVMKPEVPPDFREAVSVLEMGSDDRSVPLASAFRRLSTQEILQRRARHKALPSRNLNDR